jgi:hypothetical protein
MTTTDNLTFLDTNGDKIKIPLWSVLLVIDELSDKDKADIATAIVNEIDDGEIALSVLKMRCKNCGVRFSRITGTCHCVNDE